MLTREDFIKYSEDYLSNLYGNDFIRFEDTELTIKIVFRTDITIGNNDIYKLIQYFNIDENKPIVEWGGYNTISLKNEKVYILTKINDDKRN